jgi:hypothetical protein
VEVKAKENCLAHALVIAVARVTKDPNYKSVRRWWKILPKFRELLHASGVDLSSGGGFQNYRHFSAISQAIEEWCIRVCSAKKYR